MCAYTLEFEREKSKGGLINRSSAFHRRMTTTDVDHVSEKWKRLGIRSYRYITLLIDGLIETELVRRAAALSYTTILSIFPILALVSFGLSIMYDESREKEFVRWFTQTYIPAASPSAFHSTLSPEDMEMLEKSQILSQRFEEIFTSVSSMFRESTTGFGLFGLIGLLVTCGILYNSIESVVNLMWRTSHRIRWTQTLTNFIAVLFFIPIILGLSISGSGFLGAMFANGTPDKTTITAPDSNAEGGEEVAVINAEQESPALEESQEPDKETATEEKGEGVDGTAASSDNDRLNDVNNIIEQNSGLKMLRSVLSKFGFVNPLIPILVNAFILAIAYSFIPRTKVYFRYAFLGGLIASILWAIARSLFFTYIYMSTINRTLTDLLGVSVLFLIWIYFTWMILLLGILIVYTSQNFQSLWDEKRASEQILLDGRLLVAMMVLLAAKFEGRGGGIPEMDLRRRLGMNQLHFNTMMTRLVERNFVSPLEHSSYQIGRPAREITIRQLLSLGCNLEELPVCKRSRGRVAEVLYEFQQKTLGVSGDATLADLLTFDGEEYLSEDEISGVKDEPIPTTED